MLETVVGPDQVLAARVLKFADMAAIRAVIGSAGHPLDSSTDYDAVTGMTKPSSETISFSVAAVNAQQPR
ncbi:hypothetical protein [Bordetella sp. LUAb4]|uniref:hypothetical protein n=1 Tax=Bordetella sp. LUAb4 TaxID=2843195 RepID=UPI001E3B2D56|nr:hypothetical protein [Bordetella sp. LUAb4]